MRTPRVDLRRQSAAMERVQELAHAHGFATDADAQQAIYEALVAYAGEERDALTRALVQEYADALARRDHWRSATWTAWRPPEEQERTFVLGARAALEQVAERLGVSDLHERAAEVVARGEDES